MSQEIEDEINQPTDAGSTVDAGISPAPVARRVTRLGLGLTRRALGLTVRGAGLLTRLSGRAVLGTLKRLPRPAWRHKAAPLIPPVPLVTHTVSALNVEVTLMGIDGKGPVYSVIARLRALSAAGHQRQVTAQAVQIAFQEQFAAHGETVTDVTTQAIIPALDDTQAWLVYARVTKQRNRRTS